MGTRMMKIFWTSGDPKVKGQGQTLYFRNTELPSVIPLLNRAQIPCGYRSTNSSVISTFSWGGGQNLKFFKFFNATGLLKNWKKQHFICSNLTYLHSSLLSFFLFFFFFSFFFFFLYFFLFPWGGGATAPPSPLK